MYKRCNGRRDNWPWEPRQTFGDNNINNVPLIPDLRSVLNNNRHPYLPEYSHESVAEETARVILNKENVDFSTEAEHFLNYVWNRFGFEVCRAVFKMVRDQLPHDIRLQILNNSEDRFMGLEERRSSTECLAPNEPFFSPPTGNLLPHPFPCQAPASPRSDSFIVPSGNNMYRGRGNWPPYHRGVDRNYHPYERNRWRSHLDDIYLPNFEDDDLDDTYGHNQQTFQDRNSDWFRSDFRSSYKRVPSTVRRPSSLKQLTCNASNTKTRKTNESNIKNDAIQREQANTLTRSDSKGKITDNSAKTCDKIQREATKVDDKKSEPTEPHGSISKAAKTDDSKCKRVKVDSIICEIIKVKETCETTKAENIKCANKSEPQKTDLSPTTYEQNQSKCEENCEPITAQDKPLPPPLQNNDNIVLDAKLQKYCETDAVECHNLKTRSKTDQTNDNCSSSSLKENLYKVNNGSSKETDGTLTSKVIVDEQIAESNCATSTEHESAANNKKDEKLCVNSKTPYQNPFASFRQIDSDEETVCFDDFITIDKLDTGQSFLKSPFFELDDYEIIDMDLSTPSPAKRKNDNEEETEVSKKMRYDSLYFQINSTKLLDEVNEVFKENKRDSEKIKTVVSKRFRSKSLCLSHTTENVKPIARSYSTDSVDKTKFQITYNFDLKTSLLLLLNRQNLVTSSTNKDVDNSNGFSNILQTLRDPKNEKSAEKEIASTTSRDTSDNDFVESKDDINKSCIANENSGKNQEFKENNSEVPIKGETPELSERETNKCEISYKILEENNVESGSDCIKLEPLQQITLIRNCNERKNSELPTQNVVKTEPSTQSKNEEYGCAPNHSKRKNSLNVDIQVKRRCLTSNEENAQFFESSTTIDQDLVDGISEGKDEIQKVQLTTKSKVMEDDTTIKLENISEENYSDKSCNTVDLDLINNEDNKTKPEELKYDFKDSSKKENMQYTQKDNKMGASLTDIEEDLKALLGMSSPKDLEEVNTSSTDQKQVTDYKILDKKKTSVKLAPTSQQSFINISNGIKMKENTELNKNSDVEVKLKKTTQNKEVGVENMLKKVNKLQKEKDNMNNLDKKEKKSAKEPSNKKNFINICKVLDSNTKDTERTEETFEKSCPHYLSGKNSRIKCSRISDTRMETKNFQENNESKKPLENTRQQNAEKIKQLDRIDIQTKDGTTSIFIQSKCKQESLKQCIVSGKPKISEKHPKNNNVTKNMGSNSIFEAPVNKSEDLEKSVEKPNVSRPTTSNYCERFKRIRSLFGSDSESEMEKETPVPFNKTNHKKNVASSPTIIKSQKSVDVGKHEKHFSKNKICQPIKDSSKAIEKRRRSVPAVVDRQSLKFSDDIKKSVVQITKKSESVISKVKRIERRRETLPASLISGMSCKNNKQHKDEKVGTQKPSNESKTETSSTNANSGKVSNSSKDKIENVCIVDQKLKDPRKDHYRYKNLGRRDGKGAKPSACESSQSLKKQTVASNHRNLQIKGIEKSVSRQANEEKRVSSQSNNSLKSVKESSQNDNLGKNEVKNVNLNERKSTSKFEIPIISAVKLSPKLTPSKIDQTQTKTTTPVAVDPKQACASKINSIIKLMLKTGVQDIEQITFTQCSVLPKNNFVMMLHKAHYCIQENDCCDQAVTLEGVDVSNVTETVKQVTDKVHLDQEDDVIEVIPDIPVIDLTGDLTKEKANGNEDLQKVDIKEDIKADVDNQIPYKTEEMITLYRSEETVNNSLDLQVTSESISLTALNKKNQTSNCNTPEKISCDNQPLTVSDSSNKSQCGENVPTNNSIQKLSNPTSYISPLNNNVTSAGCLTLNQNSPVLQNSNNSSQIAPPDITRGGSKINETPNISGRAFNNLSVPSTQIIKPVEHVANRQNFFVSMPSPGHNGGTVQVNSVQQSQQINPSRQNITQQNLVSAPHPLAQIRLNLDNIINKMLNPASPGDKRQNIPLPRNSRDIPTNSYSVHSPMRHTDEEGPAPLHEISIEEIRKVGTILIKYLFYYHGLKKAQFAYYKELQNMHKFMPGVIRLEMYQFENYTSEKYRVLCKDLIKELKNLNTTGRPNNIVSAQVLMEYVFKAVQKMVPNLTLQWIYLMLESLMKSEVTEYLAVPFLRDLYTFVIYVTGKFPHGRSAPTQTESRQVTPPQNLISPDQRKLLEWQIKQYTAICSTQKRLMAELQKNGILRFRLNNNLLPRAAMPQSTTNKNIVIQNIEPLLSYSSPVNNIAQISTNHSSKTSSGLTVHQNIIIRPVDADATKQNNLYNSGNTGSQVPNNDTFKKIRLPFTAPYNVLSSAANESSQIKNLPASNNETSSEVNPSDPIPIPVNTLMTTETENTLQATSDSVSVEEKGGSADDVQDRSDYQGLVTPCETNSMSVKQEKESVPVTNEIEEIIEIIDLTWINDIDPKQLETEMEFLNIKKEEPLEVEDPAESDEDPFAVAPSPADSGISSPPMQVEYDESLFSDRSCICGKVAEYVCGCMTAMYCSAACQWEDWKFHRDVCQKHKIKNSKDGNKTQTEGSHSNKK